MIYCFRSLDSRLNVSATQNVSECQHIFRFRMPMVAMEETKNTTSTNSYLELRRAKIERNEKVLASLGLSSKPTNHVKVRKVANAKPNGIATTRRSSRLKATNADSDSADIIADSIETTEIRSKKRPREHKSEIVQREAKPGTTRAIDINIHHTLHGHFDYPVFIGRRLSTSGKAAVVNHAASMCGMNDNIGFNKYSGVCEFKNDALFLWVNIGVPEADVINEFLNNGKQVRNMTKMTTYLTIDR